MVRNVLNQGWSCPLLVGWMDSFAFHGGGDASFKTCFPKDCIALKVSGRFTVRKTVGSWDRCWDVDILGKSLILFSRCQYVSIAVRPRLMYFVGWDYPNNNNLALLMYCRICKPSVATGDCRSRRDDFNPVLRLGKHTCHRISSGSLNDKRYHAFILLGVSRRCWLHPRLILYDKPQAQCPNHWAIPWWR